MALQSGRYASVKLDFDTIPFLGHWEINITADSAEAMYFGSVWKRQMPTFQRWSGTLSGFFDNGTTSMQNVDILSSGIMKQHALNNLRFYVDTSSGMFFMPNHCASDSTDATAYINSYRITADKAGITQIDMNVIGYGPIALFSVTSDEVIASDT